MIKQRMMCPMIEINIKIKVKEPDDKPGYVVNDHLSDPAVTGRL